MLAFSIFFPRVKKKWAGALEPALKLPRNPLHLDFSLPGFADSWKNVCATGMRLKFLNHFKRLIIWQVCNDNIMHREEGIILRLLSTFLPILFHTCQFSYIKLQPNLQVAMKMAMSLPSSSGCSRVKNW